VSSPDLVRRAAQTLEQLDIPYLITGSVATIYWGEPRLTRDVDVVVQIALRDVERLVAAFPAPAFYVSDEAAEQAVRRRGQFNVIQPASGLKIDVMVAVMDAFDHSRFARIHRVDLGGFEANMSAPDDAILKKLVYYREGASEKHLRDIAGVMQISGRYVDREYVATWADRLGVTAEWQAVLDRLAARGAG